MSVCMKTQLVMSICVVKWGEGGINGKQGLPARGRVKDIDYSLSLDEPSIHGQSLEMYGIIRNVSTAE